MFGGCSSNGPTRVVAVAARVFGGLTQVFAVKQLLENLLLLLLAWCLVAAECWPGSMLGTVHRTTATCLKKERHEHKKKKGVE